MRKLLMFALVAIVCLSISGLALAGKEKEKEPTTSSTAVKTEEVKTTETKVATQTATTTTSSSDEAYNSLLELLKTTPITNTKAVGEQINWQVISGGATNGSSASYSLMGTVGQTAISSGSSASYNLNHGYWQNFSGGSCCTLAGDVDGSTSVDISDLTFTVDFMFRGGPAPACNDAADVNADCAVNITDLTYRVDFMFRGGPAMLCGCVGS